ncbi:uncharacterized protein LOC134812324 [Bolinopsis microptera]|uniref:uncharacterized protein LOC134812324 n=1 Tax=Bolinopsis microptera TaxID=2820187 RepID=UPI00307AEE51
MNGLGERRFSVQPPYIEPPNSASPSDDNSFLSLQLAYNNLTNQLEQSQRTNETLHNKLGQLSVHLSNVQHSSSQNAQQNITLKEENERLKLLLQKTVESRGGVIPSGLDVTREVDQRLRNLEDFCQKISDREIDRSDRLSASSGGISISNISLVSSAALLSSEPAPLYKEFSSTSEYSSLCSLDRVDGLSLREKVLELETNALKQDAKIKILERNLQEKNLIIKRQKAELDQYRHSPQHVSAYPREFTQSQI